MDDGWMDSTSRTQQNYLNKNAKCEKNKKKYHNLKINFEKK